MSLEVPLNLLERKGRCDMNTNKLKAQIKEAKKVAKEANKLTRKTEADFSNAELAEERAWDRFYELECELEDSALEDLPKELTFTVSRAEFRKLIKLNGSLGDKL